MIKNKVILGNILLTPASWMRRSLLHHFRDPLLLFQLLRYLPVPIFPQPLTWLASLLVIFKAWSRVLA